MSKKDVKTNLLSHSEAKVNLLGEYLKRYLRIICNDGYTKEINIFDLFCGQGLYENGGEGSPLVTLRQIQRIHSTSLEKPRQIPKINCRFNDHVKKKTSQAEKAIIDKGLYSPENGGLEFSNNEYQEEFNYVNSILPKLKSQNKKAFIFIDPYGYKHIKAIQIKSLMNSKNAEVLLWLPTDQMYRFSSNGTPEVLMDFIEDMGITPSRNVWDFARQLKSAFQILMGNDFFVDMFTIQKEARKVYCLYFFTSHIKGFEKMLEAKWEIDTEQGKGWDYSGNQLTLFHEQKTNALEEGLLDFLKDNNKYNGDVYVFTLRQGFLPKHTNEVLSNWQNNGRLDVILANGEKARKKSFYVAYNYYHDEFKKVTYKIS